jgi:MFS family permease
MGFVSTWTQLLGLRILLGTFEACLYPGAAFLISCWYPRRQIATRLAVFYVVSQAFAGLSAVISYGISQLHGRRGHHGWQWIFIIYGIITVVVGVLGVLLVVDFPHKATFLTDKQRYIVEERIRRDRNDSKPDEMTWPKFCRYIMDFKLWCFGYLFCASGFGSYALGYFMPQILQSIGFTNALSQLLMAPPYVYMVIPAVVSAKIADRVPNMRAVTVIFNCCCTILGTALYTQLGANAKGARYFGIFLAAGGVNSNVSLAIGWGQATIRAQSKRGFASALIVAWGGIGGILASVTFIQKEAPTYSTGIYTIFAFTSFAIVICVFLAFWLMYQNRRADRGEVVLEDDPNFRYQW